MDNSTATIPISKFIRSEDESSDDEAILYNPKRMMENKKDKYFMTFGDKQQKSTAFEWSKLSQIICNKRDKAYNRFLGKVNLLREAQSPK